MQAMNTRHPGSMVTVRANSQRDAISRLEYLVMMGSGEMPLSAIRDHVICLRRLADNRHLYDADHDWKDAPVTTFGVVSS